MSRDAVLDASALLALVHGEAGASRVAETIPGACICAVNLAEVYGKLADLGMPEDRATSALSGLGLRVVPLDARRAQRVGALRPLTRTAGLSLADRCCLALAEQEDLPALTADRSWSGLGLSVRVEQLR